MPSPPISLPLAKKRRVNQKTSTTATRSKVLDFYKQAAESLKAAENFAKQTGESKGAAERPPQAAMDAKAEQKRLRESTQLSKATGYPKQPETRTVATLEHELVDARSALDPLLKHQVRLEKEPNRRSQRRKAIQELLLAAQSDGRDLRKQLGATTPKDEPDVVTVARRTSLQARLQCIDKEVPALHAELALYEAEDAVELVRLRRDLLAQRIALAEQRHQAVDRVGGQSPPGGGRTGRRRGPPDAKAGRGTSPAADAGG